MIIANFIYLILALILFSAAPISPQGTIRGIEILGLLLLPVVFWALNRYQFNRMRRDYEKGILDFNQVQRSYMRQLNLQSALAILFFSLAVFSYKLKTIISQIPLAGRFDTVSNILGLLYLFLFLAILWHTAFRAMRGIVDMGNSAPAHVWSNLKFNLAILLPYIIIIAVYDLLSLFQVPWVYQLLNSTIFQITSFVLIILVISPLLVTYFWDCRPLEQGELRTKITTFCQTHKIRFKNIMSWNALNKGLVTAAVIGAFPFSRYLLITPRLRDLLTADEIMAVVAHESGHVKKRHIYYYIFLFVGFTLVAFKIIDRLFKSIFVSNNDFIFSMSPNGRIVAHSNNFLFIILFIIILLLYFRFVFGYFMRNFERQADLFCFESGINPDLLVSSFEKLGEKTGKKEEKSYWHHYTLNQRINFLQQCASSPETIINHHQRVKHAMKSALFIFLLLTLLTFNPYTRQLDARLDRDIFQSYINQSPDKPIIYLQLAQLHYNQGRWRQAKAAYQQSLKLNPRQADALNNLAWLLLTCPDKRLLNPKQALRLAESAVALKETHYILDTLAEALLQNGMFSKAIEAEKKAIQLAPKNMREEYEQHLKKMRKRWEEARPGLKI